MSVNFPGRPFLYVTVCTVLFAVSVGSAYGFSVDTVYEGLRIPWSADFSPDGRIFVTERDGRLLAIEDGTARTILELDVAGGEGGLLGVALDPDFEGNGRIYLYYTYQDLLWTYNRISQFTEADGSVSEEEVLLDKIPAGFVHNGGRIRFGPDGALYAGTGDAGQAHLSQDVNSLAGKILRINPDGSIPSDNPFAGSPVYALGLRNTQGFDWHPDTGKMYATDHGPSGERGRAHDEINLIEPGGNYGWPETVGDERGAGYTNPVLHTGDTVWAPSGASFYHGDDITEWENRYLVAALYSREMRILELSDSTVLSDLSLFEDRFGRIRDVQTGPDESVYLLTSNRDGRGSPTTGDDRIVKITPDCRDGRITIFGPTRDTPACVWPDTALVLAERGWTYGN